MSKPYMRFPSIEEPNGNIFAVMALARKALKNEGMHKEAVEMIDRVTSSSSYEEAITIIKDYVDPV